MPPRIFLIGFVLLFVSACATGPEFSEVQTDSEESVLYIYRIFGFGNGGERPSVHLNGQRLVILSDGGYTYAKLKPGKHNLKLYKYGLVSGEADEPYYNITFEVEPNSKYYVKWSTRTTGHYGVVATFDSKYGFVNTSVGESEIQSSKLITPLLNGTQGGI